ncbi:cysteine hydrolase [Tessaracoccus sp. OS52]|uniref:cysteine hydrolase family protein n=1 Tax=Tessaracoccus sp. OS52 TaxID=2886691 RepID=UPI001D0FB175|nr:isochorismatase family cysteine hydrolase [Tessaracoccus sp. OS52]MCC2593952.1 cysteine hydrolase [Tessaracoccus sp. OS52]
MVSLLLIDLQRGMCDDDGPAGAGGLADAVRERQVLQRAAELLATARERSWDVTHVHLAFDASYGNRTNRTARFGGHEEAKRFLVGSRESEIREEVRPADGEHVVAKGSVSPFASTGLLGAYLARGVDKLVIAGLATHLAVESAAREAADRGIDVYVVADACATPVPELHEHAVTKTIPAFATVVNTSDVTSGADFS